MVPTNNTIAGYDRASVWAVVFGRDKAGERLKKLLDEEEATHKRLIELTRTVSPAVVHCAVA